MKDEYAYLWAQWGILNNERYRAVLQKFGSLKEAWHKITSSHLANLRMRSDTIRRAFETRERLSLIKIVQDMKRCGAELYTLEDADYPKQLKQLDRTAPPFLFVRGKLPDFSRSLSVVGTRSHSHYGEVMTKKFTADLVAEGFVIVSGLAMGIDTIAHRQALLRGGITVAVLGTGVDRIYPAQNHRLAAEILERGGAIVSPFPLGTQAMPHHFPQRNEIVAGLTLGTLVAEGGDQSGALITADFAVNLNREVFAVPRNVNEYALSGTNKLIRKGEAKLVENMGHILEEFDMQQNSAKGAPDFNEEETILVKHLSTGSKTINDLCELTQLKVQKVSVLVTQMCLRGAAIQQGLRFSLP